MKIRTIACTIACSLAVALTACSKLNATHGVTTIAPAQILDTVANQGKGFEVGSSSTTVVYALFDPSCGHCAHLWQASKALRNVKFVWIPVSIMRPHGRSTRQGAALLTSSKAAELMDSHESSILAGTGGLSADNGTPESVAAIEANTKMFTDIGLDGVPFIVAKHAKSGKVITNAGAMTSEALATWLGADGM